MKTLKATLSLLCLLLPSVAISAEETLPYYNTEEFTPHWIDTYSEELKDFHTIPSFSFIDQEGKKITDRTFENKIYVANFFFTSCPGICPTIRSKLSKVQDKFINDPQVKILSHSIQPSIDTVEVLKQYANEHNIESDMWHLVTGDKDAIYALAKSAYFANEDLGEIQNSNDFLHTENLLLIDQNKHIRGVYNGLNTASVNYLMADIETLKTEMNSPMMCH
jgi:protein SCO1/2